MALVPINLKVSMYDPSQPEGVITVLNDNANAATSVGTQYTMADIIDTVNTGSGGVSGTGTTSFLARWSSATGLTDSDIEKTATYSAPNGGQYELRGNLKIYGEASGSGVAALFIEDSFNAKIQIRDVDNATGALNTEFEIRTLDSFTVIGDTVSSPEKPITFTMGGNSKWNMEKQNIGGSDFYCFAPGASDAALKGWENIFVSPVFPAHADDAAAGAAGILPDQVYQTDGTGAAPLNVPGILMVKQ